MRKLFIILAVVFAISLFTVPVIGATTCQTRHHMMRHKTTRRCVCHKVAMHRRIHHRAVAAQAARGPIRYLVRRR